MSPATKNICLYRVNVTLLADGLHKLAVVDGGNETEFPLSAELPTYLYWGMSGTLLIVLFDFNHLVTQGLIHRDMRCLRDHGRDELSARVPPDQESARHPRGFAKRPLGQ